MWLKKFFQIIDRTPIGRYVDKKIELVDSTDPDRIYVENIRSFFNLTTPVAKIICEMAVTDKLFRKKIAVECPSCGKVISSYENEKEIPPVILCETCELLEKEKFSFSKESLNKVVYYQLNSLANE